MGTFIVDGGVELSQEEFQREAERLRQLADEASIMGLFEGFRSAILKVNKTAREEGLSTALGVDVAVVMQPIEDWNEFLARQSRKVGEDNDENN